jgi:dTDP-4-dehydrorhamnose 3,5-epimerase
MGGRMNVTATAIAGVQVVETERVSDERGDFARLFCAADLRGVLGDRRIVQINESRTRRAGAVRGLHFQLPPHAEMKLVRCVAGRVWDVAVDVRAGSATFLQWHAVELSAQNARMLIVPEGVAHGFQVLDAPATLLYLHTASYAPQSETGLRYDDARLAIRWPLEATDVSARDRGFPALAPDFAGIAT